MYRNTGLYKAVEFYKTGRSGSSIRVREAPLKKLSKWNVVVPFNADAHEAALLVLEHLQAVLDLDIPRMDERRAASGPLRAAEAEAYIEKLLREKEAAGEE